MNVSVTQTGGKARPPVPLSPLQRAALLHDRRILSWSLFVPLDASTLMDRVEALLPSFSPLSCSLVNVPGLRLPRQQPQKRQISRRPKGGWEIAAGATSLRAVPTGGGCELTVVSDPVFADAATLEILMHRLAGAVDEGGVPDFLSVAADHQAMQDDGELADELAFWDTRRSLEPMSDDLAAALAPRSGLSVAAGSAGVPCLVTASLPVGRPVPDAELAHLALSVLVERLAPQSPGPGRLVDVRSLMGLEGVPGRLSQVLPDVLDIDPRVTVGETVSRQRGRHAEQEAFAGGPALRAGDTPPLLVFDVRPSPTLPAGWRLLETAHTLSNVVLLHVDVGPDSARVVASSENALPRHALQTLVDGWAYLLEQFADRDVRPCDVALMAWSGRSEVGAGEPLRSQDDLCRRVHGLAVSDGNAPALRRGGQVMSRQELLASVGAVLESLEDVGPGSIVGVLAPAGLEFVTAALATLWRGAAFLPLDPDEPPLRLREALSAVGARHVVVTSGALDLETPLGCTVVRVPVGAGSDPGPPMEVDPGTTAYVLRTSGSTGRPKYVPVRRDSLCNHLRWACESLFDDYEVLPAISSPVFDASLKQLLGPLWAGRQVHLLEADRLDVGLVNAELTEGGGALVLNCVPSYWSELLRVSEVSEPLPLRRLLLGGEPVTDALLERTFSRYPRAEVWNLYGPTEATVTTTAGRLLAGEPVHVGVPVAGATVTVVDRAGHPLPDGLRGEVWIQGPGLSPGYLNADPETTSSAFVLAGFDGTPRPAYRTGDLGSLDKQGRLCLIGREDDQVKVRGWRIELGEINRVAELCPGVERAVAVLVGEDEPRLRLFTTGRGSSSEVRAWLTDRLPEAMVPSTVSPVGRIPLTTTGKVDRQELVRIVPERDEVDPAGYSDDERVVAAAWREVLGGPWPHAVDDFFAVGGHSLLLARLVNRLRAQGYTSLSLRQVVRGPTVASIAMNLTATGGSEAVIPQP